MGQRTLAYFLLLSFLFVNKQSLASEAVPQKPPFPRKLSGWNLFKRTEQALLLAPGVSFYYLTNPLFTDYARKKRTIWLPKNKKIKYKSDNHEFEFPLGTVLTKTFSYLQMDLNERQSVLSQGPWQDHILIETRILVKTEKAWIALPYVWDNRQEEAYLSPLGQSLALNHRQHGVFTYRTPNINQCRSCHIKIEGFRRRIKPLGVRMKNVNAYFPQLGAQQMQSWSEKGWFTDVLPPEADRPQLKDWLDENLPLGERVKSYLDINCAHCHSRHGPANTSGLFLNAEEVSLSKRGICKTAVASGGANEEFRYDIEPGNPSKSLLLHRLKSQDPAIMMPELGRSLVHREATELIASWILHMDPSTYCDR